MAERQRENSGLKKLGIELPIIQAPMAGSDTAELAAAVSMAGGLGSLACASRSPDQIRAAVESLRSVTEKPFNLNFFCHPLPVDEEAREMRWRARLAPYYAEFGLPPGAQAAFVQRLPFDDEMCRVVEDLRPPVVSFHFGLPEPSLLMRVKATGAVVLSSATTMAEARWLETCGCDMIIAQGVEAGGHRGLFLDRDVTTQVGTMALVPQIVDAVSVPVIAAGGITDGRGIAAAMTLGACAAQLGTAYLFCPEARLNPLHEQALRAARDDNTALTNLFTGRPARGIINRLMRELGALSADVPDFPLAGRALAPLRAAAEAMGSADFTNLWAGQAAALCRNMPAGELTRRLAEETGFGLAPELGSDGD